MPSLIKIPFCTAEIRAHFARPIIQLIADKPAPLQAVVDALLPFGFNFENVESNAGTMAQHKVIFRMPTQNILFEFGAQGYRFVKDASTWETAEEDVKVVEAGEAALLSQGAKVTGRSLTVAMHLQLLDTPRADILFRFAPKPFFEDDVPAEYKPEQFGFSLTMPHGSMLVDYSKAVANGIFLRFTSDFDSNVPISHLVAKVRRDEDFLAKILDVKGELS